MAIKEIVLYLNYILVVIFFHDASKIFSFYRVIGVIGCIWFVFWAFFIYETPEEHPWITEAELKYIQSGRDQTNNRVSMISV